jgi:hypothetical protein
MITITEKYKYYEAKSILRNELLYDKKTIEDAKKLVLENQEKYNKSATPITNEQRQQIKNNNPNTYL